MPATQRRLPRSSPLAANQRPPTRRPQGRCCRHRPSNRSEQPRRRLPAQQPLLPAAAPVTAAALGGWGAPLGPNFLRPSQRTRALAPDAIPTKFSSTSPVSRLPPPTTLLTLPPKRLACTVSPPPLHPIHAPLQPVCSQPILTLSSLHLCFRRLFHAPLFHACPPGGTLCTTPWPRMAAYPWPGALRRLQLLERPPPSTYTPLLQNSLSPLLDYSVGERLLSTTAV